jgi:flagellar hook assembly protein FlgD
MRLKDNQRGDPPLGFTGDFRFDWDGTMKSLRKDKKGVIRIRMHSNKKGKEECV